MRIHVKYFFMSAFTVVFVLCFSLFCFAQIDNGYTVPPETNVPSVGQETKDVGDSPDQQNRQQAAVGKPPSTDKPWLVELYVKRYLISHTSYEFGNPETPFQ